MVCGSNWFSGVVSQGGLGEVFLRPSDRRGRPCINFLQSAQSLRRKEIPSLLRGSLHVAIPPSRIHYPRTESSVMAVRSKKKGSGQSDDTDHPGPAVEGSISPASSTASSEAVADASTDGDSSTSPGAVPTTPPPLSANADSTLPSDKYV